ncbi:MAG: methyltransferase domain-containing protein [Planctomycetota bacterium]
MPRVPPAESHQSQRHAEIRRHAQRRFDRWAVGYDRSRLNELVFFPAMRACQEEITRWQARRGAQPYRWLDVGCGTGTLLSLVAPDSAAELLVGIDYSPIMVGRFAEKIALAANGGRPHAVQADAERLPFADASFDVITCCNSFHHYPHQAAVLCGFRRLLRPGGLLVLIDGFRDNLIGWIIFDVAVAHIEGNVHHATWSQVRDMLKAAGFADLRQRKLNVLVPLLVSIASV